MTISYIIGHSGRVGKIDILAVEETNMDSTFPDEQFYIPGYKKNFS